MWISLYIEDNIEYISIRRELSKYLPLVLGYLTESKVKEPCFVALHRPLVNYPVAKSSHKMM